MDIDIDKLKRNCADFGKAQKNIDVLKNANGERHYTEIAKIVDMHETAVSGLLRKAEKIGLAKKLSNGNYKKKTGILGYMPRNKSKKNNSRTITNLISKVSKTKRDKGELTTSLSPSSRTFNTVDKMTDAYAVLYKLENTLRELIRKVFLKEQDWWKNRIPSGIQKDVQDTLNKTPYHAATRNDELEYTHLGQLKEIIICKKNWNDFLPFFKERDKNAFSVTINRAIASRNAVGHCIPLKTQDLKVVDVRFKDILNMMN